MSGSPPVDDRRWYERIVTGALVIVGFAAGSVGLTFAAELLGDEPVLTDEFNAPAAEDDTTDGPVVVAVTATTTTLSPPTTIEPATAESDDHDERRDDRDDRSRERSDRDDGRGDRRRV